MRGHVNPSMLVLARECAGLTQAELARVAGVSQGAVSKYESGASQVSDEDLLEIAKALDFPPTFFLQTDRVYGFGSACFYHRKKKAMPVNELRVIHAKLNIVRMHVTRLLRAVDIETDNKFCRMDVDEFGSPEEVAGRTRIAWGLPLGPVDDVVGAIENSGGIIWKMPFGNRRLDAVSQLVPGLPPLFLLNSEVPGDRLRFTLAHELGHVLMHHTPNPDMESQADRFAAEFLLPANEVKSQLRKLSIHRLPDLKLQWKVSMAAIIKRAFDLGAITQRHYRTLFTQMTTHGWRIDEPIPIASEEPTVLRDIISAHFSDLHYSTDDMCRLIEATERRFRSLYLWQPTGLRIVS